MDLVDTFLNEDAILQSAATARFIMADSGGSSVHMDAAAVAASSELLDSDNEECPRYMLAGTV